MNSKSTSFPLLTKKEKENWSQKMGKNYRSLGGLRKTSKEKIQLDLKVSQIGEIRIVETIVGPCELLSDEEISQKKNPIEVLEELLVISGSINIAIGSKEHELTEGQILIFDSRTPLKIIKVDEESHTISVHMPLNFVKSWIPRIYDNLESKIISPPNKSAKLLADYLKLINAFAQTNDGDSITYQTKAIIPLIISNLAMLVFALADLEVEKPTSIKQMQLETAKQFILVHASDSTVTPAMIAKQMGISVRYLHWIFHQSSETVGQYLIRKRLELAQLLLTTSPQSLYSVTEIAFMSGFNDSTHFSRRFKQHAGISPSKYRSENYNGSQ
jgi:AraC-like DNA-binding protein